MQRKTLDKVQAALRWIVQTLEQCNVPFQVTGGLAAQIYGSARDLYDIDISIPEDAFATVLPAVGPFVKQGPLNYQDAEMRVMLLTLHYQGQDIDLGGAYETEVYDKRSEKWVRAPENLATCAWKEVFGIRVPVIAKNDLLHYKRIMARAVDLEDVRAIEACQS